MPSRRAESLPLVNEEAESSCISPQSNSPVVSLARSYLKDIAFRTRTPHSVHLGLVYDPIAIPCHQTSLERANTLRATAPPSRLSRLTFL